MLSRTVAAEKDRFLKDHADRASQPVNIQIPYVYAVEGDPAGSHIVKAGDEVNQGRFPGTRRAQNRNRLSRFGRERNIPQHRFGAISVVAEADLFKNDPPLGMHKFCRRGRPAAPPARRPEPPGFGWPRHRQQKADRAFPPAKGSEKGRRRDS